MQTPIPEEALADAIVSAPAWALISLTMSDEQLRQEGAHELAKWIAERVECLPLDQRQMILPL